MESDAIISNLVHFLYSLFVDAFNLEEALPDELRIYGSALAPSSADSPSLVPAGNLATVLPKSQSQVPLPSGSADSVRMPAPSSQIPSAQASHKQLSQLLSQPSDRNSPNFPAGIPSPSNVASNSPHPARNTPQPQPSPVSISLSSMQSPTTGTNINIKSPINSSINATMSRPTGNLRTTPSPRVQSSLSSSPATNSSMMNSSATNLNRNVPAAMQFNQANQTSAIGQQHNTALPAQNLINGPARSQISSASAGMQGLNPAARVAVSAVGLNSGSVQNNYVGNLRNPAGKVSVLYLYPLLL